MTNKKFLIVNFTTNNYDFNDTTKIEDVGIVEFQNDCIISTYESTDINKDYIQKLVNENDVLVSYCCSSFILKVFDMLGITYKDKLVIDLMLVEKKLRSYSIDDTLFGYSNKFKSQSSYLIEEEGKAKIFSIYNIFIYQKEAYKLKYQQEDFYDWTQSLFETIEVDGDGDIRFTISKYKGYKILDVCEKNKQWFIWWTKQVARPNEIKFVIDYIVKKNPNE